MVGGGIGLMNGREVLGRKPWEAFWANWLAVELGRFADGAGAEEHVME